MNLMKRALVRLVVTTIAVELYYYIKGGTVDYGAAHAAKYGHERYGKTYEGVYKDWQPGQKYILSDIVWAVKRFVN